MDLVVRSFSRPTLARFITLRGRGSIVHRKCEIFALIKSLGKRNAVLVERTGNEELWKDCLMGEEFLHAVLN